MKVTDFEAAVLAYYDDGLSIEEIAKELDMTEKEVNYILKKHHVI